MFEFIKTRFGPVFFPNLHSYVEKGKFDIMDPNGDIILPQTWSFLIQPGWMVTMAMWPMPEDSNKVSSKSHKVKKSKKVKRGWFGKS